MVELDYFKAIVYNFRTQNKWKSVTIRQKNTSTRAPTEIQALTHTHISRSDWNATRGERKYPKNAV